MFHLWDTAFTFLDITQPSASAQPLKNAQLGQDVVEVQSGMDTAEPPFLLVVKPPFLLPASKRSDPEAKAQPQLLGSFNLSQCC